MGIWRVDIFHGIKVEEAGMWDVLCDEGVIAIPSVVGKEPGCAERDDAGFCRKLAGIVLEG
jgi:hypothetical protein